MSNTTNICFAGSVGYKESSKLIEMLTPSYIEDNILIQNEEGKTLVHTPYFMIANKAAEMSPRKFRQTVLMKDNNGKTPLHYIYYDTDTAEFIASVAQQELKSAMFIQDKKGKTPLHYNSAKVAKIFAEKLPREFMQAIHICDNKGLAPYEYSYNTKDMLQIMTKIQ